MDFWDTATCGDDAKSIAKQFVMRQNVVGADHVGLGSDFDGSVKSSMINTSGEALLIHQALLNEGFTDEVHLQNCMRKYVEITQ